MNSKTRNKLKGLAILALGCYPLAGCNTDSEEAKKDPNIIFVMVDDMGYADKGKTERTQLYVLGTA